LLDDKRMLIFDESIKCSNNFKNTRNMISEWFADIGTEDNDSNFSELLLSNFYRWLRSTNSKLYDPLLFKMINKMIKKVFLQLLSIIKKGGSKIIFASYNKLIFSTEKEIYENSKSYITYLLSSLQKKKLFSWIEFDINKYYEILMWNDKYNYAGMNITKEDSGKLELNWNYSKYLPGSLKKQFLITISDYIVKVYQKKMDLIKNPNEISNNFNLNDEIEIYSKEIIENYFTPNLIKFVDAIGNSLMDEDFQKNQLNYDFSNLSSKDVEFIKIITHTLSIDKSVFDETLKLKKNLLKFTNITSSFHNESLFTEKKNLFLLTDVFCQYCNAVQDLNLFELSDPNNIICNSCSNPYEKDIIENKLIDLLQQYVLLYQIQDLKCSKCSLTKEDNMSNNCECSGGFVCKEDKNDIINTFKRFDEISTFFKFDWLKETLTYIQ
jgi:DNA polymerase epsilon subunit 1